jgi:hypothetical protein
MQSYKIAHTNLPKAEARRRKIKHAPLSATSIAFPLDHDK